MAEVCSLSKYYRLKRKSIDAGYTSDSSTFPKDTDDDDSRM